MTSYVHVYLCIHMNMQQLSDDVFATSLLLLSSRLSIG